MNEMSNGSQPRRALHLQTGLAVALLGGFAVTMAACPGPTPHAGTGGSGGEGSTASSTSESASASASASESASASSSSASASSSSGGMACVKADECPAPQGICTLSLCQDNMCISTASDSGAPCKDGFGGHFCDGAGKCLACLADAQCQNGVPPSNPCNGGFYTAPPTCNNGVCEAVAGENCAAAELVCTPSGCAKCGMGLGCGLPVADCVDSQCQGGLCKHVSLPVGNDCLLNANGTCDAGGTCQPPKSVFVTSMTFAGSFGSAKQADDACQGAAGALIPGANWYAWISDAVSTPFVHFTKNPGAYRLLDGTIVAVNWNGLVSGNLVHGIDLDENKNPVVTAFEVWTGTTPEGNLASPTCSNWKPMVPINSSGIFGSAGETAGTWSKSGMLVCANKARLYCFEQ